MDNLSDLPTSKKIKHTAEEEAILSEFFGPGSAEVEEDENDDEEEGWFSGLGDYLKKLAIIVVILIILVGAGYFGYKKYMK
jgi:hypothetical protein